MNAPALAAERKLVAYFSALPANTPNPCLDGLRSGLAAHGWVPGLNYELVVRSADGGATVQDTAKALAAMKPDVFVVAATSTLLAVRGTTPTIPIVTLFGLGLQTLGVVKSLDRPDTNVTGQSIGESELPRKMLDLLLQTVRVRKVAYLANEQSPIHRAWSQRGAFADCPGCEALTVWFNGAAGIDKAWRQVAAQANAVVILPDIVAFSSEHARNAAALRLPAISYSSEFVANGGLMSYGYEALGPICRSGARFVDQILSGEPPGKIPVEPLLDVELTLNMKAAQALGISFPRNILLRANRRAL